jgi:serine/threonine protein kinase/tetratricopeptide (TPR) repeat protein
MPERKNPTGAPLDPCDPKTARSSSREFMIGQVVAGRYEVRGRLGEGGMGTVWRAYDRELEEEIALKILLSEWLEDQAMLRRFRREVKIARKITHPNVCRVFDYGEADGLRFLTMELVSGQTLRALLSAGPIDPDRALDIVRQVAEGLAAAHEQQVIHRDLKPGNVILRHDGRVVVVDFGLARSPRVKNTSMNAIAGTPGYMSPEQLRGEPLSVCSDVFALGILAFELLTGRSPFDHSSSAATTSAILRDPPRALEVPSLPASTVSALDAMLARALAKSPDERFSSAAAFVNGLALARLKPPPANTSGRVEVSAVPRVEMSTVPQVEVSAALRVEVSTVPQVGVSAVPRTVIFPPPPRRRTAWVAAAALAVLLTSTVAWRAASSSPHEPTGGIANSSSPEERPSTIAESPASVSAAQGENGRPSLIVAPFDNLTSDAAWDSLALGAAEMIRAGLRTVPDLDLLDAPRASDALAEATRRGATWIVTGTIQRVGQRLRATAQIRATLGAAAGEPIQVDGDPADPAGLLESLRSRALDEARLLWQDHERRRRAVDGTTSEAARTKLLAYYGMIGPAPTREHFTVGKSLLDEAIAANPAYVPARVERAYLQARGAGAASATERLSAARSDVDQALTADPSSPTALVMRCRVLQIALEVAGDPTDEEIAAAFGACDTALKADPSSPHVRIVLSRLNDRMCEDENAMALLEQVHELDRSLAGRSLKHLVELALQNGRMQVADAMSRRLVDLEDEERRRGDRSLSHRAGVPPTSGARLLRAAVLMRLGRPREAQSELEIQLTRISLDAGDQLDEMTALRGLLRIAAEAKTTPPPGVKQRLGDLERQHRAALARDPHAGIEVANAYQWTDPDAAVAWLDESVKSGAPGSCDEALRRALFYREAKRFTEARRAADACTPRRRWERGCAAWLRARLTP